MNESPPVEPLTPPRRDSATPSTDLDATAIDTFLHEQWPGLAGPEKSMQRADFVLSVLSVDRSSPVPELVSAVEKVLELARTDDDEYVQSLAQLGASRTASGTWNLDLASAAPILDGAIKKITSFLAPRPLKFHAPALCYLNPRVADTMYKGGVGSLDLPNVTKPKIKPGAAIPLFSKRLQSYGFKKESAEQSPTTPHPITTSGHHFIAPPHISPSQAPTTPAWMQKNRATGLQSAAYGTRRTSTGPVKPGLMRESNVKIIDIEEVRREERQKFEAKKKEEDEKRMAKEKKEKEKEDKKLEKQRQRDFELKRKQDAEDARKAKIAKLAEEKERAAAEKAEAAQKAKLARDKAAREKLIAQEEAQRQETERRLEAARAEQEVLDEQERAATSEKEESEDGNGRSSRAAKRRRVSAVSGSPDVPPNKSEASHRDSPPASNTPMEVDAPVENPAPAPAAFSPTYQQVVGDAAVSAEDERIIKVFLAGQYEQSDTVRSIELGEVDAGNGKKHIVTLMLSYSDGKVKKLRKAAKRKRADRS
ncbi:hypothetical protein HKX48_003687 [Thoreauomyces humboldtii]|nr:hypothetical protein HKX48_003687 [Thoreauomyces humboldtii]